MDKKITSIRMKPQTAKKLRVMAAIEDLSQGDLIETLIQFRNFEKYLDDAGKQLFNKVWDSVKFNVLNKKSGWKESNVDDTVTVFFE